MDIEQVQGEAGKTAPASQAGTAISSRGLARRNFTKAGIGASGVLLTLVSQPGMATSACRSPSGSLSGGLQSHAPLVACSGKMPDYYKNNSAWPTGANQSTVFSSVFATPSSSPFGADSTTLGLLLDPQSFDGVHLGMYMVATYLNILSNRIGFLSVPQLQDIWHELLTNNYYSPTAGVQWDASRVVTYLSGTGS